MSGRGGVEFMFLVLDVGVGEMERVGYFLFFGIRRYLGWYLIVGINERVRLFFVVCN